MSDRSVWSAILRGISQKCPACGGDSCFDGYLKIREQCRSCGEEFWHHRCDDAPPYVVIFIVGHIVVPLAVALELSYTPPLWIHATIWSIAIIGLSLLLLPRVKGAVLGIQWANRMHGFGDHEEA
ncbi:MAG: DUF983 domain-containing protein [Alphaproteobacteria bacterium]